MKRNLPIMLTVILGVFGSFSIAYAPDTFAVNKNDTGKVISGDSFKTQVIPQYRAKASKRLYKCKITDFKRK